VRVLTWNLFHGRAKPPAGRSLANEFAAALAGWEWDVALLQEVPPWWPEPLGRAAGAEHAFALTSRNWCLCVRRAIASRNPDLLGANGGGCNAILVRGPIRDRRETVLTRWPERRVSHGVALADGTWMVNLHATTDPKTRTRADIALTLETARAWADGAPFVIGGDFNLVKPSVGDLHHAAGHHVDHIWAAGFERAGDAETLDAGRLSDHRPLAVTLRRAPTRQNGNGSSAANV
jgi:endonuclease/exonuclease/phosphatase family metal-dependent hydrolase